MLDKSKKLLEHFDLSKISKELNPIIENIIENWGKTLGEPDLKKSFFNYWSSFMNSKTNSEQIYVFIKFFKDNNVQDAIINFIFNLVNNVEKIIFKSGEIDTNLYNELIKYILISQEKNSDILRKIINEYSRVSKELINIDKIINSLLIIREILVNVEEDHKSFSILNFKMHFEYLKTSLKEFDKQNFEIFIFDLLIKLSFIIESHVQNVLRLILKLDNLMHGKEYNVDSYELAKLLWILIENPVFKEYRNAIFHSDFRIEYNYDFNKNKVLFKDYNNKTIVWMIDDVFDNFLKIILLIKTVDAAILSIDMHKELIFEIVQEFFNLLNNKTEEEILKELLNDTQFMGFYNTFVNEKFVQDGIKKIFNKSN